MSLRALASFLLLTGAVHAQTAGTPSALVQPALGMVQQTLGQVHVDRWKGAKGMREEASTNIASLHRDMDSTLPGLLATADASPSAASALLPAVRNLDALYDVLLRVTLAADAFAPQDQAAGLEQALAGLDSARRTLADQAQSAAVTQEQRVKDLQATLAARPAPATAPMAAPAVVPTPAPHPKKKIAAKKAHAPAAPVPPKN